MGDIGGKVIFRRSFRLYSILVMVGVVVICMIAGLQDRNPAAGMQAAGIGLAIIVATLYLAARLAGRKQLSMLSLDGEDLLVRRVHFLDLGEVLRLPLREIAHWEVKTQSFKRESYSDISFSHNGRRFAFYLSDEARPDMAAIEAMIPASAWDRRQQGGA